MVNNLSPSLYDTKTQQVDSWCTWEDKWMDVEGRKGDFEGGELSKICDSVAWNMNTFRGK